MGDSEHCAVCAEPLEWVAVGLCGHQEACHQCTARLRFVCKDKRCVICKQARWHRCGPALRAAPDV